MLTEVECCRSKDRAVRLLAGDGERGRGDAAHESSALFRSHKSLYFILIVQSATPFG